MTEQTSKLGCFYVGFNGVLRGGCRLVSVAVESSVNGSDHSRQRHCMLPWFAHVPVKQMADDDREATPLHEKPEEGDA